MKIKTGKFKIIVKPNAGENRVNSFDMEKGAYRVSIKAKPEGNKANAEIIRFLSKLLKQRVKIVYGLKSKEKIIEVLD